MALAAALRLLPAAARPLPLPGTLVIVAGVDGSAASLAALRFALDEAVRRHTGVRAVLAWTRPVRPPRGYIPKELLDPDSLDAAAWHRLQEAVDAVAPADGGPLLELVPVEGAPATVLIGEAQGAELLVVGGPSRGALGDAVHGSALRACLRHAPCPVVVVPALTASAVAARAGDAPAAASAP
jgi:nucleotide-binding universal stress UspA family protein